MIKNLSNKFMSYLVKKNIISDEIEIYQYGFELILSYSVGFTIILIISIFTDSLISAIIYIAAFYYIRKYTGGYHCKTYFSCNLSFIGIYLIYSYLVNTYTMTFLTHGIYILSFVIIWLLAPCDHENKILNEEEAKKYGIISKGLLILYSLILCIFYWINTNLILPMELTLCIIAILLIMGKIERRVEKHV